MFSTTPNWIKLVTFAGLPAAGFGLARFLDGYQDWLRLGPGGLPYNTTGFLVNLLLTALLAKRETKSLEVYSHPEKSPGWDQSTNDEKTKAKRSFLNDSLPHRSAPESEALHWVAPQREWPADQYMDPKLKEVSLKRGNFIRSGSDGE